MDKKATEIVFYLGIIGWLISYCLGEKNVSLVHKNQGFVLALASFVSSSIMAIPFIGWIIGGFISLVLFVLMIIGILAAAKGEETKMPIIGDIQIFKE